MATDGLWDVVSNDRVAEIVESGEKHSLLPFYMTVTIIYLIMTLIKNYYERLNQNFFFRN